MCPVLPVKLYLVPSKETAVDRQGLLERQKRHNDAGEEAVIGRETRYDASGREAGERKDLAGSRDV